MSALSWNAHTAGDPHGRPAGAAQAAELGATIFAAPFVTAPCREGTHDCRFALCGCRGHRGTRRGEEPCTLRTEEER